MGRLKNVEKELSALTGSEQEILLEIEQHSISSEKLVGKHQALQEKLDQLTNYIRSLGALSSNQINKHSSKSIDSLNKTLRKIKKDLKKYDKVNKKALDQYNSFSK